MTALPVPRQWPPGFERAVQREAARVLPVLRGRVLDLGFGLDHLEAYRGIGTADDLVALAPSIDAARRLERRAQSAGVPLRAIVGDPENLGEVEGTRFDTVVSVVALPLYVDLDGTLAAIASHLVPGGRLLAVEPTADHRAVRRALGVPAHMVGPVVGLHLEREVPSAIRRAGLPITDLERSTMPTLIWPLRTVVRLVARRPEGELAAERAARDVDDMAGSGSTP